ncbi:MAG: isoprenyl transferase [Prevotella sp.]|nr:isoprenyl transferase [Prevotella sp.]
MIDKNRIPQHIAIIMDGNGRWAMEQGKERTFGHIAGVETVKRITADCVRLGVKYLTLYAFSTENWNRPQEEVSALMGLVLTSLKKELFDDNQVRMRMTGDRSRLPKEVLEKMEWLEEHTASYTNMTVTIALSYSSRWEMTDAVRKIAEKAKNGSLDPATVTEQTISEHLDSCFQPDPDLLIRTGGEQRISNFLLWQIAYAELYFTPVYWPDFTNEHLLEAVEHFQSKQRRYGKTEAQIEAEENK